MPDLDAPRAIALCREPGGFTRGLTALVLRLALGVAFVMFGIQKYQGQRAGEYPKSMIAMFEGTWLNEGSLNQQATKVFATALPYAEIGLGALLIVGVATTLVAFLTGLLLVALLFGQLVLTSVNPEMGAKIPTHFIYILIDAAILWLSPVTSNYLSVDGLLFGWFWKPRSVGDFRREEGTGTDPRVRNYAS